MCTYRALLFSVHFVFCCSSLHPSSPPPTSHVASPVCVIAQLPPPFFSPTLYCNLSPSLPPSLVLLSVVVIILRFVGFVCCWFRSFLFCELNLPPSPLTSRLLLPYTHKPKYVCGSSKIVPPPTHTLSTAGRMVCVCLCVCLKALSACALFCLP